MNSDFSVGFKQGQEHGKQIIIEKVENALTDIQTNIDSMKEHAKEHEKEVRQNGELIAAGLEMARNILKKHLGEDLDNAKDNS